MNTCDELTFSLNLQGLPTAAAGKPALRFDTAPSVLLVSQLIIRPSFELAILCPTPTIFSDDPDNSKTTLLHQTPLLCHKMASLAWWFSSREYVDLWTATTFPSSPHEGHFKWPPAAPPNKHARIPYIQDYLTNPSPFDPAAGRNKGIECCKKLEISARLTAIVSSSYLFSSCSTTFLSARFPNSFPSRVPTRPFCIPLHPASLHFCMNSCSVFLSALDLPAVWPLTLPLLLKNIVWTQTEPIYWRSLFIRPEPHPPNAWSSF